MGLKPTACSRQHCSHVGLWGESASESASREAPACPACAPSPCPSLLALPAASAEFCKHTWCLSAQGRRTALLQLVTEQRLPATSFRKCSIRDCQDLVSVHLLNLAHHSPCRHAYLPSHNTLGRGVGVCGGVGGWRSVGGYFPSMLHHIESGCLLSIY